MTPSSDSPSMLMTISTLALAILTLSMNSSQNPSLPATLRAVPFEAVQIRDQFFRPRIETNHRVTLAANLDKCEETGRIANFAVTGGLVEGEHRGKLYNDSDLYKVLEGVAYTLKTVEDPALEKRADEIIAAIASAQGEDGYLSTYYTLVEPEERWQNIAHGHELYCAGHLIEAALAYHQATGKRVLLDVAIRFADLIDREFGPDGKLDPPGHQELELALFKLARATGEERYAKLGEFFLEQRGSTKGREQFGAYCQDHLPIREQTQVRGHAVRAMYQFAGMADLAALTGDESLMRTLDAVWRDVTVGKMYVTGGIGNSAHNEGFTEPFELPNDTAYAETCAAIGMALWNHRMWLATGERRYVDVLELEVYNNVPAGVSLGGDRFFYVNPLATRGDHHRVPWFDCSCCPTNIARFVPSMGERIFAVDGENLWVGLYVASEATVEIGGKPVKVNVDTQFPWSGEVRVSVESEGPIGLRLRIPEWCRVITPPSDEEGLLLPRAVDVPDGWLGLSVGGSGTPEVRFVLGLSVRRVFADPRVVEDRGRVAVARGPILYAFEATDHDGHARNLVLPRDSELEARWDPELLGGVMVIEGDGLRVTGREGDELITEPVRVRGVPYCTWDNREAGEMVVWLPESVELAEVPGEEEMVIGDGYRLSASHTWRNDDLGAVALESEPKASNDHDVPRHTFWDHRGTTEWIRIDFDEPREVSRVSVYWFDDAGNGGCRVPKGWRLLRQAGDEFWEVKLAAESSYGLARDAYNSLEFEPVTTSALRLEVNLQPEWSGGVLRWRVE